MKRGELDLIARDPGQLGPVRPQQADGAGHDRVEDWIGHSSDWLMTRQDIALVARPAGAARG